VRRLVDGDVDADRDIPVEQRREAVPIHDHECGEGAGPVKRAGDAPSQDLCRLR
jgi:hypothetical protein